MLHEKHVPNNPPADNLPEAIVTLQTLAPILSASGFASNQLGFDSVRVVIIRMDDGKYQIFNNPQIIDTGTVRTTKREACFSMPRFSANVERWESIKVQWMTGFGEVKTGSMIGDEARTMQHEIDHLDGILISDRSPLFGTSKIKRMKRQFKKTGWEYTVNELGVISDVS